MRIATLSGIPVRLHWSFLGLVGIYLASSLVGGGLAEAARVGLISVALFGSVVLHEFGHALAARFYGIGTASITLYPFGGIAAITRQPTKPTEELVIALAGPAVNFLLVALALTGWAFFGGTPLLVFAGLNLIMGVFNLIPAFPMDGGRVLRALLASRLGWVRGSRVAMRIGRGFAWLFVLLAVVTVSPSLLLVGAFLHFALTVERRRLEWSVAQQAARRREAAFRRVLFAHPTPGAPQRLYHPLD